MVCVYWDGKGYAARGYRWTSSFPRSSGGTYCRPSPCCTGVWARRSYLSLPPLYRIGASVSENRCCCCFSLTFPLASSEAIVCCCICVRGAVSCLLVALWWSNYERWANSGGVTGVDGGQRVSTCKTVQFSFFVNPYYAYSKAHSVCLFVCCLLYSTACRRMLSCLYARMCTMRTVHHTH